MLCLEVFMQISSIVVVLIIHKVDNRAQLTCDSLKHKPIHEGNLGQTGVVPWLGVIRAHMHLGGNIQIAVTGAVLIKPKHAIANADDMAKIRKKGNSKAMFISSDRGIWTCKLSEVAVHPEYEFATYNTIALVELDTESISDSAPMLPICTPTYMFNTSNHLYAFGFTDEHKLLEKMVYKVQYVEKTLCDEFYKRAGHGTGPYTPQLYECAFAENNHGNCEWENGMALASNVTGSWVLVGFGVQGPGCSAPARFIDIYPYLKWIESSSTFEDFDADYPFKVKVRRADTIDSIEHLEDDRNSTNYFKRVYSKFNMTFREFFKQSSLNMTTRVDEYRSHKNNKHFKKDNTHSDAFESNDTTVNKDPIESIEHLEDDINMTNYFKRDRIKFNMTFREFLKQYKSSNRTSRVGEGKITQNVTHKKVNSKINNDTRHLTQDKIESDESNEDNTANNTTMVKSKRKLS